jgi:hypothetical protein
MGMAWHSIARDTMRRLWLTAYIVLACVALGSGAALAGGIPFCTRCAASSVIAPALLVVRPRDLPGFAGAKGRLYSTTSAFELAHEGENSSSEAESEAAYLTREGFREGVEESFHQADREGVSEALVFDSARAAKHQLITSVAQDLREYEKASLKRFVAAGVPGSVGLGNFNPGKRGATGNVLFSTGRCFFLVGDLVHDAITSAQGTKAPIAGAKALYKRTKRVCG